MTEADLLVDRLLIPSDRSRSSLRCSSPAVELASEVIRGARGLVRSYDSKHVGRWGNNSR